MIKHNDVKTRLILFTYVPPPTNLREDWVILSKKFQSEYLLRNLTILIATISPIKNFVYSDHVKQQDIILMTGNTILVLLYINDIHKIWWFYIEFANKNWVKTNEHSTLTKQGLSTTWIDNNTINQWYILKLWLIWGLNCIFSIIRGPVCK